MLKVTTNNKPRPVLPFRQLSKRQSKMVEDNYGKAYVAELSGDERFIFYKGWAYSLNDFMGVEEMGNLSQWHGAINESYFSGVLIKILDCGNVIVGSYTE